MAAALRLEADFGIFLAIHLQVLGIVHLHAVASVNGLDADILEGDILCLTDDNTLLGLGDDHILHNHILHGHFGKTIEKHGTSVGALTLHIGDEDVAE